MKKLFIGFLLGIAILFSGCGDKTYTKEELSVDINKKIVYEKDGKTLASGKFNYKNTANEEGEILLKDGLVSSIKIKKGEDKVDGKFKDKKLSSLDMGKNGKVEFFDNNDLKYVYYIDNNAKAEVKYKEGEKSPYYALNEAKPSNSKILFEDDILTISKLKTNKIIETHKKDSMRTSMILEQIDNSMKFIVNKLNENTYNNALKEIMN